MPNASSYRRFGQLFDRQPAASLQLLPAGLDVFNMTKAKLSLCHFYAMFAAAHRLAGNIDEALRRIDNCIQFAAAVENRMLEALGQAES